jgi:glycosyltransferase involved in cell wall biosynthesis
MSPGGGEAGAAGGRERAAGAGERDAARGAARAALAGEGRAASARSAGRPDVLLLSLGTTLGWRAADALFAGQLREAGASVAAYTVRVGATGRLRRAYPVTDLVEAVAARRALRAALGRERPRALVISSTTAAMLADVEGLPYAVRLDAPARLNRPGLHNAGLHALERRALARARLVLPWSRAALASLPDGAARAVVVPPPIAPSGEPAARRERLAVAYTPDVKAKGLDIVCAAWARAALDDARLLVFGVDRERALAHLQRTGTPLAAGVDFPGKTPPAEFRHALRRARAYVGGARWEDFGMAPLEALADGALLVTVPSGGPFEALAPARELAPELVAPSIDPEPLAAALREAFAMPDERAARYRARAAELVEPFRPESVQRVVTDEVLPALLAA